MPTASAEQAITDASRKLPSAALLNRGQLQKCKKIVEKYPIIESSQIIDRLNCHCHRYLNLHFRKIQGHYF